MKVSIVIPIYNVEKYVEECIESVLCQTYEEIEIILIDDRSTDNTMEKVSKYLKDSRINLITNEINSGLSASRNIGLEFASGKYILFLDSDDFLEEKAIETLVNISVKEHADLVQFGYKKVNENSEFIRNDFHKFNPLFSEKDYAIAVMSIVAWNKFMKIELARKHKFPVGKIHEDLYTSPRFLSSAVKIIHSDEILHNYRIRNDSIMSQNKVDEKEKIKILLDLEEYSVMKYGEVIVPFQILIFKSSLIILLYSMERKGYFKRRSCLKESIIYIKKYKKNIRKEPMYNELLSFKKRILLDIMLIPLMINIIAIFRVKVKRL